MASRNLTERKIWAALGGAALGAALSGLLDPASGRRRRARLRDKAFHLSRLAQGMAAGAAADLAGRSHGIKPALRRLVTEETVDDRVLVERVRAVLGRWTSHPHSIGVVVEGGKVTLTGPIVASEAGPLLARVRRIPGVKGVEDALKPYEKTAGVPGLQGGRPRKGGRPEPLQERWSPAWRLLAGGAAGLLLGRAFAAAASGRSGPRAWAGAAAGAGMLVRSWFNEPLLRIFGFGGGPEAIRLQKAINVDAPVDAVFRVFASYDNFPLYMPHVKEVHDLGQGRSHWKVQGPAGVPVEWDAEITELVADRALSWRSLPGAWVPNAGSIRFAPNARGGTTVDIKLGYHPPAGELGHAFARLLGADPKRRLDRDLMILKDFVERHAAATTATTGPAPARGEPA